MKFIILSLIISYSLVAFSQSNTLIGNGGDVVTCRTPAGTITSVELLDFYEIKNVNGYNVNLDPNLNHNQALNILLNRLKKYDSYPSQLLTTHANDFFKEAEFINDVELVDIQDTNHIFFPQGCFVEQIVVQIEPKLPGEKRYFINQNLWDSLNGINKAGLILHEVLLRQALLNPETKNSKLTRFLTGLLAADKLDALSFKEYYYLMKDMFMFRYSNIGGQLIDTIYFSSDGEISAYDIAFEKDSAYSLPNGIKINTNSKSVITVSLSSDGFIEEVQTRNVNTKDIVILNRSYDLNETTNIYFDKHKKITSISKYNLSIPVFSPFRRKIVDLECHSIYPLYDGSYDVKCEGKPSSPFDLLYNTSHIRVKSFEYLVGPSGIIKHAKSFTKPTRPGAEEVSIEVTYFSNGFPKELLCHKESYKVFSRNTPEGIYCDLGGKVTFYDNGEVQEFGLTFKRSFRGKDTINIGGFELRNLAIPNSKCRYLKHYKGYKNGIPKAFTTKKDILGIKKIDGTKTYIKAYEDLVLLSESGQITNILRGNCKN